MKRNWISFEVSIYFKISFLINYDWLGDHQKHLDNSFPVIISRNSRSIGILSVRQKQQQDVGIIWSPKGIWPETPEMFRKSMLVENLLVIPWIRKGNLIDKQILKNYISSFSTAKCEIKHLNIFSLKTSFFIYLKRHILRPVVCCVWVMPLK